MLIHLFNCLIITLTTAFLRLWFFILKYFTKHLFINILSISFVFN